MLNFQFRTTSTINKAFYGERAMSLKIYHRKEIMLAFKQYLIKIENNQVTLISFFCYEIETVAVS